MRRVREHLDPVIVLLGPYYMTDFTEGGPAWSHADLPLFKRFNEADLIHHSPVETPLEGQPIGKRYRVLPTDRSEPSPRRVSPEPGGPDILLSDHSDRDDLSGHAWSRQQ